MTEGRLALLLRTLILLVLLAMSSTASALTLRVGVPDFRPDIYLQSDGRPGGVLGDVLSEIAAAENWSLDTRACHWHDCLAQLKAGAIDLLPNVQRTPQRAKVLRFPRVPVLLRSSRLYALDTMGLDTLEQLGGKRIAVLAGSAQLDTLQSMLAQMQVAATLVSVEDLGSAFDLVGRHEADAAIADSVFGALAAPRHHLKATPIKFPADEVFYAARADIQPAVLTAIDRHLDAWKADPNSVYYKVLDRWGQTIPEHQHPWYSHWTVLVLLVILLLAVVGYGLYHKRRKPVPSTVVRLDTKDDRNLARDLADAVKNERLTLYIQPQFAADGQAVGAELLARWQHPVHGPISPAEFIPIAEAAGMLTSLTCQFLISTCKTILSLQTLGHQYPLSLNISPKTLLDPDFVRVVRDTLAQTAAPADCLILEITEEIAIENLALALQHMSELTACGVRFSIDDFGTGYANLENLTKLPLYELKIDRSLISGIPESGRSQIVVDMILSMADRLGLQTIAEGVETRSQLEYLLLRGCFAVQGYLLARPMPIDDWLAQVKNNTSWYSA